MHPRISKILDYIYPARCHLCENPLHHGKHLCNSCHDTLKPVEPPYCMLCCAYFDGDINNAFTCPNCHGLQYTFNFARAAFQESPALRQLIHDFKYARQIHLVREIARLMATALKSEPRLQPYLNNSLLIPVPLHWKRQRQRRFNQAAEIARHLARSTKTTLIDALKRTRNTETQTQLGRKKRLTNLRGAFVVKKRYRKHIRNRRILLIDDVFTTGSTSNECARALQQAGARETAVLTLMRG